MLRIVAPVVVLLLVVLALSIVGRYVGILVALASMGGDGNHFLFN